MLFIAGLGAILFIITLIIGVYFLIRKDKRWKRILLASLMCLLVFILTP